MTSEITEYKAHVANSIFRVRYGHSPYSTEYKGR